MKSKMFLLLSVLFIGCDKSIDDLFSPKNDGYKTYTIKKGEHYSYSISSEFKETTLKFKVIFDSSAIYTTIDPSNQHDINKLYGFSDCGVPHHVESARFGWRWSEDSLRLFAYCYKDSVMSFKELGPISIGKEQSCSIAISGNTYIFNLNGKTETMDRGCTETTSRRLRLFPYFGGNETTPHDITIKIKEE